MSYPNDIIEQLKRLEAHKDTPQEIIVEVQKAKQLIKETARVKYRKQCAEWRQNNKERSKQYYEENLKGTEYLRQQHRALYYKTKYNMTEEEYEAQKAELKKKKEEFNNNVKVELRKFRTP